MKRIVISLCVIALVLTACTSKTTEQTGERNVETDFQTEYSALTLNAHPMVEVGDGYYMVVGMYIYYVDKQTMEYTPLCNKPNCLHQKETDPLKRGNCNALIKEDTSYVCLNYYKGSLYIASVEQVWKDGIREKNYVMNQIPLDGGERKIVYEFEKPVAMAIVHRGYIYYSSVNGTLTSEPAGVYRVPIDGGENETLYTSENDENLLAHFRILGNELVFTEYKEDGDNDCLWRYDLETEELKKVCFAKGIHICSAGIARDRIYYFCQEGKNREDITMSTKLDCSDAREENFVAHQQDEDYYYETTWEGHTQTVYDWKTKKKVAEFKRLSGMGAFMVGKERLFWISFNDEGGHTCYYIDREDIPKGDSAVKEFMNLSSDEAYPAILSIIE